MASDRSTHPLTVPSSGTPASPGCPSLPNHPAETVPDRSSQILATHTLIVGYDLTNTDPDAVTALRQRAPARFCSSGLST